MDAKDRKKAEEISDDDAPDFFDLIRESLRQAIRREQRRTERRRIDDEHEKT